MMSMTNEQFLELLRQRFLRFKHRHPHTTWEEVIKLFDDHKLAVAIAMEEHGGEVDVVELFNHLYLVDLFKESPSMRVSVAYDLEARVDRKKFPPATSAMEMARSFGSYLIDEKMYNGLQMIEDLDLKTSVWLLTPTYIRAKGGAIFGDKRYGRTFIYHNGADAYYGVRGFRTFITLK